jgi:hypothetical protein
LRERIFQYIDGGNPKFPADASINVTLQPLTQFGGIPGESRNSVADQIMKANFNLSTGRTKIRCEQQLFEPVESSISIENIRFQIKKNVIKVNSRCESQQDLNDLISTLYYAYPAVLNIYLPDVPFPTHAWGTIGKHKFKWIYDPIGIPPQLTIVTSKTNQEQLAVNSWQQIAIVADNRRLMGGIHYFHVACRLLEAGYTRFEFMAEALLNFAKSLQATFGESRDNVRKELTKLDTFEKVEIEAKIIPALILRNEFDIAHVSLSMLNHEHLKTLHQYTHLAEGSYRKLFGDLIEKIESKTYLLPPIGTPVLSPEKEYSLKRLAKNIKPFI